jgi:cardiolipin synthase
MIHAKIMTVDGVWSVIGSTNFDHRSFALNDEVNLAVLDAELVATIESDFCEDLVQSRQLDLNSGEVDDESVVDHVLDQES